jgi:hypothetical protein
MKHIVWQRYKSVFSHRQMINDGLNGRWKQQIIHPLSRVMDVNRLALLSPLMKAPTQSWSPVIQWWWSLVLVENASDIYRRVVGFQLSISVVGRFLKCVTYNHRLSTWVHAHSLIGSQKYSRNQFWNLIMVLRKWTSQRTSQRTVD